METFLGFFNICAGVMIVASIIAFGGGFIQYLVRLGTEEREEGLEVMAWGATILFVLVVLLGLINTLQTYFVMAVGALIVLFVVLFAVAVANRGGGEEHAEAK